MAFALRLGGIVVVLLPRESEEGSVGLVVSLLPNTGIKMVQMDDFERELLLRFQGSDAIKFWLQRLQTGCFDAALIHARGPVVADLLVHRTAVRIVGAGGLQR